MTCSLPKMLTAILLPSMCSDLVINFAAVLPPLITLEDIIFHILWGVHNCAHSKTCWDTYMTHSQLSGHLHPQDRRELPDGLLQVSLTGLKTVSQPLRWYVHPFDSSIRVRPEPYATMKQYTT